MDASLSYAVGEHLPGPFKTCWNRFEDAVSRYPDNVAMVATHQPPRLYGMTSKPLEADEEYAKAPYLRLTYRELRSVVDKLARGLVAHGVHSGMPIFTFLPNGVEFVTALWASHLLGCTIIPINIRNLANERELDHMIETALKGCRFSSAVVFSDSSETAAKLDRYEKLTNTLKVVSGDEGRQHWSSFGSLLAGSAKNGEQMLQCADSLVEEKDSFIIFTSGTTSLPKGIHWHYPGMAYFVACREIDPAYQSGPDDVLAGLAPNNHAMGLFLMMMAFCHGVLCSFLDQLSSQRRS